MNTSRMRLRWLALGLIVALVAVLIPIPAEAQSPDAEAVAQALLDHLMAGEYAAAVENFDATMRQALPEETLRQTWDGLLAQVGALQEQLAVTVLPPQNEITTVIITLQFEAMVIDLQVSVNEEGQIAGLYLQQGTAPDAEPTPAPPTWEAPIYADPSAFTEQEITLNPDSDYALPGTLTLPNGDGPFPAVVLVHGSGPNDRDEAIGPNKPFKDLAWGLASQGIAVLRYDKRTLVYGENSAPSPTEATVQNETVDDAISAVEFLAQTDGIDPARIYVAGHSLGGHLTPRIAAQIPDQLAGAIILAGNARPLEVLILEQVNYLVALDGEISASDEQQIAQMNELIDAIMALTDDDLGSESILFGAPPAYWLDLRDYDPVVVAATLEIPLLILQGERDYQVTMTDFTRWQTELEATPAVSLISYPALNHLFIPGEGPSSPEEYEQPGHVADAVVNDIVNWIDAH